MIVQRISPHLYEQLQAIPYAPCGFASAKAYPCCVVLKDGTRFERVYMIEVGVVDLPDEVLEDEIFPNEIQNIEDSRFRLPPELARKAYERGEVAMGYHIYTLVFKDGHRETYLMDSPYIDFPSLPPGTTGDDIEDIILERRGTENTARPAQHEICTFRKP